LAVGYEGYVTLQVDSTEDLALCTGASVPKTRVRLESSSGYGGQISSPVSEIGIGLPRNYDFDEYSGSINFELTEDFLINQMKEWLFDRQKKGIVTLSSRDGNEQLFNSSYWNNISISATENGVLEGSIGFVAELRDNYDIGGDYIGNKTGQGFLCDTPVGLNIPAPLNSDSNLSPIPYWNSSIVLDGTTREFNSWSLDFNQEVVKFYGCEHNTTPQAPKFIAVGPMTATFAGDFMFVNTTTWTFPNDISTLVVNMGGASISMADLESITTDDAVQGPESLTPVSVEYAIYQLVA
jgi:hypothetical protein